MLHNIKLRKVPGSSLINWEIDEFACTCLLLGQEKKLKSVKELEEEVEFALTSSQP